MQWQTVEPAFITNRVYAGTTFSPAFTPRKIYAAATCFHPSKGCAGANCSPAFIEG